MDNHIIKFIYNLTTGLSSFQKKNLEKVSHYSGQEKKERNWTSSKTPRFATRFLFLCAPLSCLSVRRCDWSAFRPFSLPISIHSPRLHPEFPIPRPPGLLPPTQARRLDEILLPLSAGPARSGDPPALIHSAGLVRYSIAPSTKRRTHKRTKEVKGRKD